MRSLPDASFSLFYKVAAVIFSARSAEWCSFYRLPFTCRKRTLALITSRHGENSKVLSVFQESAVYSDQIIVLFIFIGRNCRVARSPFRNPTLWRQNVAAAGDSLYNPSSTLFLSLVLAFVLALSGAWLSTFAGAFPIVVWPTSLTGISESLYSRAISRSRASRVGGRFERARVDFSGFPSSNLIFLWIPRAVAFTGASPILIASRDKLALHGQVKISLHAVEHVAFLSSA